MEKAATSGSLDDGGFAELLRDQGYFNTDKNNYGSHTQRAVMAFRKVNGMERNFNADPGIFKYTVKVTPAGANPPVPELDPIIIIER